MISETTKTYIMLGGAVVLLVVFVAIVFIGGGDDSSVNEGVSSSAETPSLDGLSFASECVWEEVNSFVDFCDGDYKIENKKFSCGPVGCGGGSCTEGQEEWRRTSKLPTECFGCRQQGDVAICENELDPPDGLSVVSETDNSIIIRWDGDERVDFYEAYYCEGGVDCNLDTNIGWSKLSVYGTSPSSTNATEASVGDLISGKSYRFKIRSVRQDSFLNTTEWAVIVGTTKASLFQVSESSEGSGDDVYNPPRVVELGG